jgi:SAM-dependent methyltransferase
MILTMTDPGGDEHRGRSLRAIVAQRIGRFLGVSDLFTSVDNIEREIASLRAETEQLAPPRSADCVGTHEPVRWGNVRRLEPFDAKWGFGRGTPVDRWPLGRFFDRHRLDIRGRVLEVSSPMYAAQNMATIERMDILDIDPSNLEATIIADLDDARSLPASAFDCVICPQTLQYVRDLDTSLSNLWQSLAPGGVLLLSVPATAQGDPDPALVDRWRVLPGGLATLVERNCPGSDNEVTGAGNVLAAISLLLGLAAEELTPEELDTDHREYPLLSFARVQKPYEGASGGTRPT